VHTQVLKYGRWERVKGGQMIIQGRETHLRFFVLVEGLASLQVGGHSWALCRCEGAMCSGSGW